jgi:hypothetical protein
MEEKEHTKTYSNPGLLFRNRSRKDMEFLDMHETKFL